MTSRWARRENLKDRYLHLAVHDPYSFVRATALANLEVACWGTGDPAVGKVLAEIVCNDSEKTHIREGAYIALWLLVGRPVSELRPEQFRLMQDVDNTLLNRFLGQDEERGKFTGVALGWEVLWDGPEYGTPTNW